MEDNTVQAARARPGVPYRLGSYLAWSAGERLAPAALLVIALWLAVWWAVTP